MEHVRHGRGVPRLLSSVDYDAAPIVPRMVAAFGLVHEMTCLYGHSRFDSRQETAVVNLKSQCLTRSGAAANPVLLPKAKPRTMREHFVVPSIRRRDVACAERPNIRCFEHFLELLDVVNDAFHVHASQSSRRRRGAVKPRGICRFPQRPMGAIPPGRIGAYGGSEQLSGEGRSRGVPTQLSRGRFRFCTMG